MSSIIHLFSVQVFTKHLHIPGAWLSIANVTQAQSLSPQT